MTTFTINQDNNISTFAAEEEAAQYPDVEHFSSVEELAARAASWPATRLVEIWNVLPDVTPLKKFTDRATAIARIWKAIQPLAEEVVSVPISEAVEEVTTIADPAIPAHAASAEQAQPLTPADEKEADVAPHAADVAPIGASASDESTAPEQLHKAPREGSKGAIVLALLRRKGGTTLEELMSATGWQKHSIRGFLSGTVHKKMGLTVVSTKNEGGERTYSLPA